MSFTNGAITAGAALAVAAGAVFGVVPLVENAIGIDPVEIVCTDLRLDIPEGRVNMTCNQQVPILPVVEPVPEDPAVSIAVDLAPAAPVQHPAASDEDSF